LKRFLFFMAALAAGPVWAEEAPQPIQGTWTGRIGNSPVNACFTQNDAHYFYLKHLNGIQLAAAEGNLWAETNGKWKIDQVTEVEVQGVWLGDGKRLTIHLNRLAPLQEDGGCGAAYYAPVLKAIKYEYRNAKVAGLPLRIAKSPLGEAFELTANSNAAHKINAYTRHWLNEQAISAFSCQLNGGGGWESDLTADRVIGDYLLVGDNEQDNYCGGPHGNSAHSVHTFDLRTGDQVNTLAWLKDGEASLSSGSDEHPKHPLRKLIEKLNPRTDCKEFNSDFGLEAPYPTDTGLAFYSDYPHAGRACNEAIVVSYGKLGPFLSNEGKAFVRSMQVKR